MALGIAALISVLAAARAHASGSPAVSLMASTRVAPPVYTASAAAPFHATPLSPVAHHKSGAAVSAGPLGRSVEVWDVGVCQGPGPGGRGRAWGKGLRTAMSPSQLHFVAK